ncbi:MAG TPA: sugar nucleotide-binding protein, partial [Blastocatellia bacterium]
MTDKLRVAVTGASGFIGKEFLRAFHDHEVAGMCHSRVRPGLAAVDLKDRDAVRGFLVRTHPDVVVHCAARPSVDWCELNPGPAREINFVATSRLAEECGRIRATFVFLSTDYVFDGASGPYTEADIPNPINMYGRLKLEAEEAIRGLGNNHIIVRTTNVYGFDPESKNFLMALLP